MNTDELGLALALAMATASGSSDKSENHFPQFRNKNSVKELIQKLLEAGFTRADIAKSCDVSRLTICAWEVGEMTPNKRHAQVLETLSKVF